MLVYVVRRILQAVVVVLGVLVLVFVLINATGDPARLMVPLEASEEDVERVRRHMGLDRPLREQFARFMANAMRGDFGQSLRYRGQPAMKIVTERFPATLRLTVATLAWGLPTALLIGAVSAVKANSFLDRASMILALTGQSVPGFWLGLMLILLFSVQLRFLPASGAGSLRHLVLPSITLGSFFVARTTRLVRSSMMEVLNEDYIRTARAKGLAEAIVLLRHAAKNVAIPVVTIVGLDIGVLLGGAVITETVFAWPGIGRLVLDAITYRDFPVVMANVFFIAMAFVTINLVVDLAYVWLDPRVRLD